MFSWRQHWSAGQKNFSPFLLLILSPLKAIHPQLLRPRHWIHLLFNSLITDTHHPEGGGEPQWKQRNLFDRCESDCAISKQTEIGYRSCCHCSASSSKNEEPRKVCITHKRPSGLDYQHPSRFSFWEDANAKLIMRLRWPHLCDN